ncbi:MAG TPA: response regulator [Coleofasciculaceae cyanobacterium]|jgi:CheY-like chemotaxis protein
MPTKLILLIDSEPHTREVLEACLSDLGGWNVQSVASAQAGLESLVLKTPDAILLNMFMPGMNGMSYVQRLHAHPQSRSIPVILLTTKAHCFTPQQLEQMGVMKAIATPFDPLILTDTVTQALKQGDLIRALTPGDFLTPKDF